MMNRICVFCGSSDGSDPEITKAAIKLGNEMVSRNQSLVYGGAKIGVMGTVAKTVLDGGADVVGIIPKFLMKREVYHDKLTELIVTKNMNDRKLKMLEVSDGFVTLPGGFGTLEELFEIATGLQLDQHQKPIGLLNVNGYYDELIACFEKMVNVGFLKQDRLDLLIVDNDATRLLDRMAEFSMM